MSQAKTIIPAGPEVRRSITRLAYRIFTIGTGVLVIGAIGVAVSLATSQRPSTGLIVAFTGLACVGSAILMAAVSVFLRVRQPIRVEITPDRLIWREGPRIATLEYDEVERVEMVRGHRRTREGFVVQFPVVRFIENDGEMMEFEVSFDDHGRVYYGRFDAQAILEAVLPYLRQQAVIAPAVDEYLTTGMVDIDGLAER